MGCCSDEIEEIMMDAERMHGGSHGGGHGGGHGGRRGGGHGGGRRRVRIVKHEGGCGCGCGPDGHGGHGGHGHGRYGFQRQFESREEKAAKLEAYLADLKAEAVAVEEKLAELRG